MSSAVIVAGAAVLSLAGLAGCGGSSSSSTRSVGNASVTSTSASGGVKTFSAAGLTVHFKYPATFRVIALAPSRRISGDTQQATHAAVGIAPYDLLVVTRFPKRPVPVTAGNIASLKSAFDRPLGSAFGRKMSGTVTKIGGLPALSYAPVPVLGLPVGATSRVTLVFVANDEYELNCQYTPKGQATIGTACRQMLSTLTT